MSSKKKSIGLVLRGMAMGAADVVPGVSGGTIAFITGIYEELIETISNVNLSLFSTLKEEGLKAFWKQLNGNFIVALFLGIGISIVSLSKILGSLLQTHPSLLWSFFFGLIIASVLYMAKQVPKWNITAFIGLIIGAGIVLGISLIPPFGQSTSLAYIFVCGMIAICAMILPGISGSFLLLILGAYQTIIGAVNDKDLKIISVFAIGCLVGLLAFSKVLKWIFKNYKNITFAILTGFLVGSVYKLWPWRHINKIYVKHIGEPNEEVVTLVDTPVWPNNYDKIERVGQNITGYVSQEPNLLICISLAITGFLLIFLMEKFANLNKKV
jgi:putative membrane protein